MSSQNNNTTLPTFDSGEPGSTGYEVFEDSTATGPAPQFQAESGQHHGTAGDAIGIGSTARAGGDNEVYSAGAVGSGGLGSAGDQQYGGLESSGQQQYGSVGSVGQDQYSGSSGLGSAGQDQYSGSSGLGSAGQDPYSGSGGLGTAGQDQYSGSGGLGSAGQQQTGIQTSSTSQIGDSYGSNPTGNTGGAFDRTGDLDQNAALYERTGDQGPVTSGAAGTDRFDSDRGVDSTTGAGNSFGTRDDQPVQDTTQRAEGKGTGGILGVLGTSDRDFTGRDRTGPVGGAYSDTEGRFQGNTSGPGGNTALTGREGNIENNPVAQAKSRAEDSTAGTHSSTQGTHSSTTEEAPHKESLLEKAKHAVGL